MKRIVGLMILSLLPLVSTAPQTTAPSLTAGMDNGRQWNQMTIPEKITWIRGYSDGLNIGCQVIATLQNCHSRMEPYTPTGLTYGETVAGIDKFYSDTPENGFLPVSAALEIVALKAKGSSQAQIDAQAAEFRKVFAPSSSQ